MLIAVLALCALAGSVGAAPSGLVAAYSFNEGAGASVGDVSGNNNTGSVVGATWSTSGKSGGALSFSSSRRAYVSVPDSASLHLAAMTLEAWVKPNAVASGWRTVIFKERPAGMTYSLYADNGGNRPAGQVFTTAQQTGVGTSAVPVNTWTHLAATFAAGTLRLFVNGTQVAAVAVSGSVIGSTGLLTIGGNAIWDEWFDGLIDEVRIYNRALSAGEIQTDMATPVGTDSVPPSTPTAVSITGRTQNSVSLSWGASTDNVGVAGYGVYANGALTTTAPAPDVTLTGLACGTTYTLGVDAFDQAGNRSGKTTTPATTSACDTTPPTTQITSPSASASVSGQVTVNASAQDDTAVAGVQFKLDGQALGNEDTSAPYSVTWNTTATANGSHTLTATARDAAGNIATSAAVIVIVQNQSPPNFATDTLVTGLDQPTQIVFTPDGRMLILERSGTVLVVQPGANRPDPTPFLQLSTVNTSDERGALGIVLDPAFATNGFFYVMYTHSSLINRVSRFTAVGTSAQPSSESIVWQNDVPAAIYHQGGGLAFGADGDLYISVGDNLNRSSAQDLGSFNGKILRIRPDGSIPTDNPFFDGSGRNKDAVWALGLRNPFRFSFDPPTGRMLIGDVGESTWEELDLGAKGANYGWPTCEGTCGAPGMVDPLYAYPHNGRDASITGGLVFRGGQFGASVEGSYFFGDYAQNVIRRLTFGANGAVSADLPFVPADGAVDGSAGDPVDICQGPDGALYYVDIGALDIAHSGTIRRVRNLSGNLPPTATATATPTNGAAPLTVAFSSNGSSDPEGKPLTYVWDFGDGATSTSPNPSHAYAAEGSYIARLSVSDGSTTSFASPIQIRAGTPPVPKITSPIDGSTFQADQQITFTGSASDTNDGALSGASLSWTVVFHHETHQHPGPGPFTGTTGSFTVPSSGHDFTGNTSYEIVLTATDSSGLSASTSVSVNPRKVNMTFASSPPGLTVVIDSLAHTTPYTVDTLIGFQHTIDTPSPQSSSGATYLFASWSDGGARTHDVVVPAANQTVTATFAAPARGLAAAYNFDEGVGDWLTDVSGNGNTGTIANATWVAAGKHGGALSFNGTSTMVTVPASPSLGLSAGMTLEAWVDPTATSGAWRSVIFKERPGGMLYALYAANGGPNLAVGQAFLGNAERNAAGSASIPLNTWTHLAVTFDGSALHFYVNGALTSTLAVAGSLAQTTGALRIGGNSIWGEYYRGLIDDVRIYSRPLSIDEIGSDMATAP